MEGSYLAMKIDCLITFFILAPIWRLVAKLLSLVRANSRMWVTDFITLSYLGYLRLGRPDV